MKGDKTVEVLSGEDRSGALKRKEAISLISNRVSEASVEKQEAIKSYREAKEYEVANWTHLPYPDIELPPP